jgi:hypothetical protein
MKKKIDFLNGDENSTKYRTNKKSHMTKRKATYGSKTAKKIKPDKADKSTKKLADSDDSIVKKKKKTETGSTKRRGRRPKKILDNFDQTDNADSKDDVPESKNDSAVILRLNIDPSKLKKLSDAKKQTSETKKKTQKKITKKLNIASESSEESSEGMFKNDIPDDNVCHKCLKNEKTVSILKNKLEKYENKEKIDRSTKIYSNNLKFISMGTDKKITIKKTNIKCWWDGHTFNNLPCFLPELYHNSTYHVIGCFCSFNCALAHNLYYLKDSKIHQRKTLIYKLYRELHGLSADDPVDIKEAPPKEILEDFGGDMSIDVFRRSFITINKEYLVFVPPIKPINMVIEERNLESADTNNGKKYVLKRSKPLSKKRTIISSMQLAVDNEEDDD